LEFQRHKFEHLTALMHSRTTTSDVDEGDQANISNDSHVEERENFRAVISTHVVNSRAVKRRSSVLDDLRYGGLMRRIRQKANLYSQGSSLLKHKIELDLSAQRLLLSSKHEQKASKAIIENGETSKRNLGYASAPVESTQNGIQWRGSCRSRNETEDEEEYVEETIQDAIMIEMKATVVDGHGTETGHIIVTTIGDRNELAAGAFPPCGSAISLFQIVLHKWCPKSFKAESFKRRGKLKLDETEDEEEYVEETIQDAIMIVAAKTSCIWSYSQGMKVYAFIIMLAVCTFGLGPGCIFTLTVIAKWECSSYGRALASCERHGVRFPALPYFFIVCGSFGYGRCFKGRGQVLFASPLISLSVCGKIFLQKQATYVLWQDQHLHHSGQSTHCHNSYPLTQYSHFVHLVQEDMCYEQIQIAQDVDNQWQTHHSDHHFVPFVLAQCQR
nr:nuclear pore complex protein NUP1-like [Tanacetum cinerariifolium]